MRVLCLIPAILLSNVALAQETDYTAVPNSVLKLTIPSGPCITGTPPADATSLIQGCINAGGEVEVPSGIWNVTGLTCPASGALSLHGVVGQTILHLIPSTGSVISCSGFYGPIDISGLIITGNSPNYTGYGTGAVNGDAGQRGIHLVNFSNVRVVDVTFNNIYGNGLDCENPNQGFNNPLIGTFTNIGGSNNYRLIYPHNFCEHVSFTNIQATNNVVGAEVESGNVYFANSQFVYNTLGVKIYGLPAKEPCRGTFSGGTIAHNTWDLTVVSCGSGENFSGVTIGADQSGAITAGAQNILIYNSRGVSLIGGTIAGNVVTFQADPWSGDTTLNGANLIVNNYIRDDIANFVPPSLGTGTILLRKENYDGAGFVSWNN